jgi:hypothetical protein
MFSLCKRNPINENPGDRNNLRTSTVDLLLDSSDILCTSPGTWAMKASRIPGAKKISPVILSLI